MLPIFLNSFISNRFQRQNFQELILTVYSSCWTDNEDEALEFKGTADSFVEIPNDGKLDTQNSMTILANVYPTGSGGPILNYKTNGWGVHLWQFESTELFVRFVHRNGVFHKPIASRVLQVCGRNLESLQIWGHCRVIFVFLKYFTVRKFLRIRVLKAKTISEYYL